MAIGLPAQQLKSYRLKINGRPELINDKPDTLSIRFSVVDSSGSNSEKRINLSPTELNSLKIKIREQVKKDFSSEEPQQPEYIQKSIKRLPMDSAGSGQIPKNITVSLLVDRSGSMKNDDLMKIKHAVFAFVNTMPEGSVYYSDFNDYISKTTSLTLKNFDSLDFSLSSMDTDLYNAIQLKILEFDKNMTKAQPLNARNEKRANPNYKWNDEIGQRAENSDDKNYLIILTDGKDDTRRINKYTDGICKRTTREEVIVSIRRMKDKVKVFTIGYGKDSNNFDEDFLIEVSNESGNKNGYFQADPDLLLQFMETTLTERFADDYELRIANPKNKTFSGYDHDLTITISDSLMTWKAEGTTSYKKGSNPVPYRTGGEKRSFWLEFTIGLAFLLIVIIIIQLIWPLIKNLFFTIRYVKRYKPVNNDLKRICPYCFDTILPREKIVLKCEHFMHKNCWDDNNHSCPEYGQNCTEGKQDYFDVTDPFSKKNKMFYLKWVLYGMAGSFLAWIVWYFIMDAKLMEGFTGKLVLLLSNTANKDKNVLSAFIEKLSPLFVSGMSLGFFLSLFFSYAEEYRRLSWAVSAKLLLRSVIGVLFGFISMLLGGILIILTNVTVTNAFVDWIPWLFFGVLLGYSLTVKTTIYWKHGLLGGLVSIIFSFIILYGISESYVLLVFMLYGAGVGASISTIRSSSEIYFLQIMNGPRNGNKIAIHKWMNTLSGMNEVYIGRSNLCEIQMNWEKSFEIADKHAKIYLSKTKKIPVAVALEKGKTTLYNDRIEMMIGKEYEMTNGSTIKIGETLFKFIEKE